MRRILVILGLVLAVFVIGALAFLANVFAGVRAGANEPTGTLAGLDVRAPVRIDRDGRGIPHVRAQNERDMFFAEGFVQGTDRLFQIDIYRRAVGGRLSEVFGSVALPSDVDARIFDIAAVTAEEERRLSAREHEDLEAFAAGVNAAMRTRPLPPEFRILGYRPEPWTARDSLLTAFSTVIALADHWDDVAVRADIEQALGKPGIDAFFPITDPAHDAPTTSNVSASVAPLPALGRVRVSRSAPVIAEMPDRTGLGSNDFAAGATLTASHRALLGNDPHLALRIPGVWYLADLAAPGIHVAGATLAGVPGIVLGHNAHLAWGSTNGTVANTQLYRERFRSADSDEYMAAGRWLRATRRDETFKVRFAKDATHTYLSTRHGFVIGRGSGIERYAAAWAGERDRRPGFRTFSDLDRAASVPEAVRILAGYPGPNQNFVLADDKGLVAYSMSGDVWLDDAWARFAHDGANSNLPPRYVPFEQLPLVAPSRDALVFTANNRVYGKGYPLRLTANFGAPYRAARIGELLHGQKRYDVAAFSAIQADVLSIGERELAQAAAAALRRKGIGDDAELKDALAAFEGFDGRFVEDSKSAVYTWALRRAAGQRLARLHLDANLAQRYLNGNTGTMLVVLLRMLREHPKGWVPANDFDAFVLESTRDALDELRKSGRLGKTWGEVGARNVAHPLAKFGFGMWNAPRFPGHGDAFSPHVQGADIAQSFRAVWDVGNWDAGGIVIPMGESGQPGSPHYRDGAPLWLSEQLVPLPFSDAAVAKASVGSLELRP